MARDSWSSRFGFVMAAAGSAVGLGNIWKFPYMTGANGGGAFLLIYLAAVFGFGLSLVMAELILGRTAQRNPVGAYRQLAGRRWSAVGVLGVATAFVILSFYVVVAGWTLAYVVLAIDGSLTQAGSSQGLHAVFGNLVGAIWTPLIYAAVFTGLTVVIVAGGIGNGIERASKLFMPLLFFLLVVLVLRSVTLPGSAAGVRFLLQPNWAKVSGATVMAAVGQAFFSLSLGLGGLITYGSYMPRSQNLPADAASVVALDTVAAILAGLMVIPAMFAFHIPPGSGGPGSTFEVLPSVFAAMPGGRAFAAGFFFLLAVAALTSSVSLLEPIVSYLIDERAVTRPRAAVASGLVCLLLAVPVSLSFGPWQHITLFGDTIFQLMDYLTSSISLPVGGLFTAVCVGWIMGPRAVTAISNDGALRTPWARVWLFVLRFVAPIGIGWILLHGVFG